VGHGDKFSTGYHLGTSKEEVDVVAAVPLDTYSEEDGQPGTEVEDDVIG